MSKGKDPAFLFYSSDFLVGTMRMTYEQKGKYIHLLCLQHDNGDYLTQEDIDDILDKKEDRAVLKKFMYDEENGTYYNERLREEYQKRMAYSESRRSNRLKGGKNKEDVKDISTTHDKDMIHDEEDKKEIEVDVKGDVSEMFNRFWKAYPRKVGKDKCLRWFKSHKVTEEFVDDLVSSISNQKKSSQWLKDGGKYIPYPYTWLNRGGWNDELEISKTVDKKITKRWENFIDEQ